MKFNKKLCKSNRTGEPDRSNEDVSNPRLESKKAIFLIEKQLFDLAPQAGLEPATL